MQKSLFIVILPGLLSIDHLNGAYQKKKVDVNNFIVWKDGMLLFDDISLHELMLRLERWYDLGFEYRGEELKQRKFTGGFRKYDIIDKVLERIGYVNDVLFRVENDRVVN